MNTQTSAKGYVVRHLLEVDPVPCPCGSSTRIITSKDTEKASFHITRIQDSTRHYHKKTTEIYHILEGEGTLEVGEESIPLNPGQTILIEAGTPHRGYGDFETIVVAIPAFDPEDEFFPENDNE